MKRNKEDILMEPKVYTSGERLLLTISAKNEIRYASGEFRKQFGLGSEKYLAELGTPFSEEYWSKKIEFIFNSRLELNFSETFHHNGIKRKFRINLSFGGDIIICSLTPVSSSAKFPADHDTPDPVQPQRIPDSYLVVRKNKKQDLIIHEASSRFGALTGYDFVSLSDRKLSSLFDTVQFTLLENKIDLQQLNNYPVELISVNGTKIPADLSVSKLENNYYIVISDRNKAPTLESLLEEKENFYKSLLENSMEITSMISKTGHFEYISPAVRHLMGYEPAELIGKNVFDFIHPDDHPIALGAFTNRILEGGVGKRIDWRFRNKFEQYRYLAVMINSSPDENLEGSVVINAVDVTERYNAERSLIKSNYRFKIFNDINNITLHSSSVKNFAEKSIQLIVKQVINCDRGSICLIDGDDAEFVSSIVNYEGTYLRRGAVIKLSEMDCAGFISNGNHYLVHDVHEKDNPSRSDMSLMKEGIVSYLVFPLTANEKLIGAIILGSRQKGFFTHDIIDFISGIATEVAVGMEETYLKEKLVYNESQKSAIIAGIPDMIFRLSKQGVFLDGVFGECELTKLFPPAITGRKITEVIPGDLGKKYLTCAGEALVNGEMQLLEHELKKEDETFFYEARFSPTDHNEVIILVRDITQSITAKTDLELRNRAIESSPEGIFITRADNGKILFFNKSLSRITGYSEEELENMRFNREVVENQNILRLFSAAESPVLICGKIEKNDNVKFQNISKRKNGTSYWNTLTLHGLRRNGQITHFVGSVMDVTRIRTLEQKMMNKVIDAQESERKRIASDLHDGLAQTLSAVNLYFQALQEMEPNKPNNNITSRITGELISRAIAESRLISYNLMPSSITRFGLAQAISELIDRVNYVNKETIIKFNNHVLSQRYESGIEITLFRVAQEIISNSIKHSEATLLELTLKIEKGILILAAEDNGKGFDFKVTDNQGLGLQNLKARIKSLNGTIKIRSVREKGTSIMIKLPGINNYIITSR